ncbi:MAG: DUF4418 family protein [Ruminococcus sp.]|nr:DUF4418 family protein [Ruminococcus sp.]
MNDKKNVKETVLAAAILICSICLCAGAKLVFHACGPKEDGSYMACHWAEQAIFGIGCAMTAISVFLIAVRNRGMKRGLALSLLPCGAVCALIPNILIKLCMMTEMRCHTVMRPAAVIFGLITAVLGTVYAVICKEEKKD